MRHRSTQALVGLVAALALALTSATASGVEVLSVSPAGNITATSGAISFTSELLNVICAVTLNGSLATPIEKLPEAQGGDITRSTFSGCRTSLGGSATVTGSVPPWELIYSAFLGTLPNISGVLFRIYEAYVLLRIESFFRTECQFRGDIPVLGASPAGVVSSLRPLGGTVPLDATAGLNTGLCPASGGVAGTFTVAPNQTLRAVAAAGLPLRAEPEGWGFRRRAATKTFVVRNTTPETTYFVNEIDLKNSAPEYAIPAERNECRRELRPGEGGCRVDVVYTPGRRTKDVLQIKEGGRLRGRATLQP